MNILRLLEKPLFFWRPKERPKELVAIRGFSLIIARARELLEYIAAVDLARKHLRENAARAAYHCTNIGITVPLP